MQISGAPALPPWPAPPPMHWMPLLELFQSAETAKVVPAVTNCDVEVGVAVGMVVAVVVALAVAVAVAVEVVVAVAVGASVAVGVAVVVGVSVAVGVAVAVVVVVAVGVAVAVGVMSGISGFGSSRKFHHRWRFRLARRTGFADR
jgi:hypothetical protein